MMNAKTYLLSNWPPVAAVVVAAAAAFSQVRAKPAAAAASIAEAAPVEATAPMPTDVLADEFDPLAGAAADGPADDVGASLSGEVLEQIDVGKYSYLRLGARGQPGVWTAVSRTPSRLGQSVTVANAELMTGFVSATLKRTFDTIYFGFLDEGADSRAGASQVAAAAELAAPHPGPGKGAETVPVGRVARAEGSLGRNVAEVAHAGAGLAGQKVRVRGIVVKVTRGVLGRTFVHLRDGTGEAADGSNDLTVTTQAEAEVGQELLVEGTLQTEQDFGSGYRYAVLLADAKPVATP